MYHFVWNENEPMAPLEPAVDMRAERRQFLLLSLSVAAVPILSIVVQYMLLLAVQLIKPEWVREPWFSLLLGSVSMYLIAMPLAYLPLRLAPTRKPTARKLPLFAIPILLSTALALTVAGSTISNMINQIISRLTQEEIINPVESATEGVPMLLSILSMGILAPIFEEIFFRKLLIDRLRRYGDLTAILVSALLFGLIHGNISQFFYAALVGILLGGLYCRTGKLHHTILLHAALNLFGGIFVLWIQRACGGEIPTEIDQAFISAYPLGFVLLAIYYLITFSALAGAVPSIIYLIRSRRLEKGAPRFSKEIFKKAILQNPMVWACVGVLALYFAI